MNRRDVILTTGSMFVSASLGAIACGGANASAQNPKEPGATGNDLPPALSAYVHGDASIVTVAQDCVTKGNACVAHCNTMLSNGDTTMVDCAKASFTMTGVMAALARLAAAGSPRLPAFAKLAMEFCRDCQAACAKHADKHPVCKDCMDACGRTIAACEKVAA